MTDPGQIIQIDIDQLDLDLGNPRHEKMSRPSDAIDYLLSKERVIDLAEDIANVGITNPMDLMGVVAKKGVGERKTYISAEGNRRVCALLLLHDPEKVPAGHPGRVKIVSKLEQLSAQIDLTKKITVCLFKSKKGVKPWIDRMHNTESKGVRRRWRPDQQERALGGGRNRISMAIVDLAQSHGLINQEEREQKLTTVQRYVGNPAFRASFGIFVEKDKSLTVIRDLSDFRKLFLSFIEDARTGKLSSRSNAEQVSKYAAAKVIECGVSQDTTDGVPLSKALDIQKPKNPPPPQPEPQPPGPLPPAAPQPRKKIGYDRNVVSGLEDLGSIKLNSLYKSCCDLNLAGNSPLITVGWWSILETMCNLHGGLAFKNYLSKVKIDSLIPGITKDERNDIWNAIDYISVNGNATKHSALKGSFDGQQIANCVDVINPLLVALLLSMPR